jgi:hypothetical protein
VRITVQDFIFLFFPQNNLFKNNNNEFGGVCDIELQKNFANFLGEKEREKV